MTRALEQAVAERLCDAYHKGAEDWCATPKGARDEDESPSDYAWLFVAREALAMAERVGQKAWNDCISSGGGVDAPDPSTPIDLTPALREKP